MQNNDDLINNILNELEGKKNEPVIPDNTADTALPADDGAETMLLADKQAENQHENSYDDYFNKYEEEPVHNVSASALKNPQVKRNNAKKPKNAPIETAAPDQSSYQPRMQRTPPKKKKKKKKRSRIPGVLILTTFIFAVSIVLSMVIIGFGKDMLGIGKDEETKLVVIQQGATTEQIAEMLKDEGIIKSPKFFVMFSRLRKADSLYKPGEHFIRANMAYETIIQNLTTDEVENKETVEVTFPEGINILDAARLLEEKGVCSASDFLFSFNAGGYGFAFEDLVPLQSNLKFQRMEGYLFPDTYFFTKEMKPEMVCQRIYLNFNTKMSQERLQKMEQLDLSLDQLITFASIVQLEAANTDDMNKVASVFWNRLRDDSGAFTRLGSDPTKNYANNVIKQNMKVYDKTVIDAYNTYEGTGLPPGAICNPGLDAIDAVLADYKSNYFYFVADITTGETFFSETQEQHDAKIEEIRQRQEEQNGDE